ncbi:hypothetical protein CHS0354_039241 [Potamilus streckersoni]|uniref:Uncharacterized protein n=1 Tax=Potamilus streckersoni TaxID=2493646 RepID=A0AAE0WC82_9BIVA|nr:hypothetical protein CHS0354_039241 [Potamilus streckersoni]
MYCSSLFSRVSGWDKIKPTKGKSTRTTPIIPEAVTDKGNADWTAKHFAETSSNKNQEILILTEELPLQLRSDDIVLRDAARTSIHENNHPGKNSILKRNKAFSKKLVHILPKRKHTRSWKNSK